MALACLAKLSPLDPATGDRVDIYVSSVNDKIIARTVNGLGGFTWTPAMKQAPLLTINLWNGDFRAAVDPGSATLPLKMEAVKRTVPDADSYFWIGAPVEIYAETAATAWPWTARFIGKVDKLQRRGQDLVLTCLVGDAEHQKNVLTATYAGTGDEEGGADLKNRLKPLVIGWAKNVEPVLIDTVNNVWQFSGYGAIEEVTTLYERGSAFSAAVADYPDFTTLIALPPPAGRFSTCLAEGMIRLGAPAYGVITGDIKGHVVGSATPRLTGEVISALATIAGVDAGSIDSDSLDALDAAAPYPINLLVTNQTAWLDLARQLALACNYQAGIGLTGKFFVSEVSLGGSEVVTLDAQGKARPQVTLSDEMEVSLPYWKTVMGANRCWRVQTTDEIAFSAELVDRGAYDDAATYREGNYVTSPDASQWLYVYPTPTSGNPPPTWPLTANTWWDNMNPPITGEEGPAGESAAPLLIYQRTATSSPPSLPSASTTYTFATAVLTGLDNGWMQDVPTSGGAYLWIATATARGTGTTDTVSSSEWAGPSLMATDGSAGLNNALVYLFKRSASTPTKPSTTSTYTFATGVLTGQDNGWTQAVPAADGNPLYVTVATASASGSTDTIAGSEWATPTIMAQDGSTGSSGAAGTSNAVVRLYKRSASSPAAPSGTFTYTFATGVLSGGTLNGWTQAIPAADGNPLWVIAATASANTATDSVPAAEFSSPVIDSGAGVNMATVRLYQRAASTPSVPASTLTYTFSTGMLSGSLGSWSQTVPAGSNPLYTTQATAVATTASTSLASGTWSSPVIMAQDGAPGTNAATVFLYRRTATNSAPTVPSTTSTYTFATGVLTGQNNSWVQTVPSSGGAYLWVTTASALGTGSTDTISSGEWATPNLLAMDGAVGDAAIGAYVTRESVSLFTYADGTVISFTNAAGEFRLIQGGTDITASATLSVVAAQCSGVINTSTGSPVAGQPKGYYRVTSMSADEATLTITATYAGVDYTKIFTVTKIKAGYEIVASLPASNLFEGRTVYLTTDDKLYRYTGSAWTAAVDGGDIIAGSILTNSIGAGQVTAAKIGVTELSAITATIGLLRTATTGARTEISDNLVEVYNGSNVQIVRMGVWT